MLGWQIGTETEVELSRLCRNFVEEFGKVGQMPRNETWTPARQTEDPFRSLYPSLSAHLFSRTSPGLPAGDQTQAPGGRAPTYASPGEAALPPVLLPWPGGAWLWGKTEPWGKGEPIPTAASSVLANLCPL